MSFDERVEHFTSDLFNLLWLDYGLLDEPLLIEGSNKPLGPLFMDDIVQAVKVRQAIFRSSYKALFDHTYSEFRTSVTDFYAYLEKYAFDVVLTETSVTEKVLNVCTFVAEMCQYAHSQVNNFFIPYGYLICAMYIDQHLVDKFYAEGNWLSLINHCQSYTLPFAFIRQHSETITSSYGKNSISFSTSDCRRSLDSFVGFYNASFTRKASSLTMSWVDYCIKDLEKSASQPVYTEPILEAAYVLYRLKYNCNFLGSRIKVINDLVLFAIRNGREPMDLLNAYMFLRPFDRISLIPTVEILALERRLMDLIKPDSSTANENQSFDSSKYEKVLTLFSELHDKNKGRTVVLESLEERLKRCFFPISYPPNVPQVSNVPLHDESVRFTNFDSAKSMFTGNENVQTSEKSFTPETSEESPGPQKIFEHKEDKDLATDLSIQREVNSPKSVRLSLGCSPNSGVVKERSSGGKRNSPYIQASEKAHSPKIFNESSRTPKSQKDKMDKDQAAGSLSQLDINSLSSDGTNISQTSGTVDKRKSRGKENSSNIQASEKTYSTKKLNESLCIPQSQKDKEDKDQITGLLSKLDIYSHPPDDFKTSQSHSQNLDSIKKRNSERKTFPPNVPTSENFILPGKTISVSPSTVKTLEGKKDGGISNLDIDSFFTDGSTVSPSYFSSSDTMRQESEVHEMSSSIQKIKEGILQEEKLIKSLDAKIQWLHKSLNSKHQDQIKNQSINTLCEACPQVEGPSDTLISVQAKKENVTIEVINDISSTDHISSPESPAVSHPKSPTDSYTQSATLLRILQIIEEYVDKNPDDTGNCDIAIAIDGSSQLPGAEKTVLIKEVGDPSMVTEDCVNKTLITVPSGISSKTSDIASEEESKELERVEDEDGLKTAGTSISPRNPSRSQIPVSSKTPEKKSKTSPVKTLTRRQQLLKTEENAKDVLRMIHVLGNKTCLENLKLTLKDQTKKIVETY